MVPQLIITMVTRLLNIVHNVYARCYYLLFLKKYFHTVGKAKARIHPSTHMVIQNSTITIDNGTLQIGYLPGWGLKENCRIRLWNSTLHIKGDVSLRPGCTIWAINAKVTIRNGTIINGPARIVAKGNIDIGEDCQIGIGITIMDCDGHKLAMRGNKPTDVIKEVIIGKHCWIGHNVSILKGVTIGEGSVIAAGSIVTKDIKEHAVAAGVPAEIIKEDIIWEP